MIAGALNWLSIPIALFIGTVGALSVLKPFILTSVSLNVPVWEVIVTYL